MTATGSSIEAIALLGAWLTLTGVVFVGYVLLGYPALLWVAVRVRRGLLRRERRDSDAAPTDHPGATPTPSAAWLPTVTVLIAAYDEADSIEAKLEDTVALDYPPGRLQILVVADGSSDDTPALARAFATTYAGRTPEDRRVRIDVLHEAARRGKTAAIVRAMPFARGEVVVFSDANNGLSKDALRHLVAPFVDATVGIVGGAKTIQAGDGPLGASEGAYWRYEDALKRMESELGSTVAVAGEILALRRAYYRPPPSTVINDDFWLAADVLSRGYRVLYAPEARSVERVAPTQADEVARRSRIVAGRYQAVRSTASRVPLRRTGIWWRYLSHKFARPLLPFAMLATLSGSVAWALGGTFAARAALGAQLLVYALAVVGPRPALPAPLRRVAGMASYLVASNWAAVVGLTSFARGRQTSVWQRVERRR